jgi:hypothetical protein
MVGGGLAFLIFGTFLDWAKLGDISGNNAFDYFFRGTIPWLLIVGTGVVAFLLAGGVIKRGGAPWPVILLGATALATLLLLLLLLTGPDDEGIDLDRAAGLWLSFLAAVVALVGAVLNFQATGADLKDLTNMDKLRSQFGNSSGGPSAPPPPPPPPGGMTPPPPPPPPGG